MASEDGESRPTRGSVGNDGTLRIWDPGEGKLLQTLTGHEGSIDALGVSPDGKLLVTGGRDKTVRVWVIGRHGRKPR